MGNLSVDTPLSQDKSLKSRNIERGKKEKSFFRTTNGNKHKHTRQRIKKTNDIKTHKEYAILTDTI
jgi:hypothetical protein